MHSATMGARKMAKQLCYSQDAREAVLRGVEKMARAVKTTLGPRGRLAVVDRGWGSPNITKDGAAVADDIDLKNPFENLGAKMVKEAASRTGDDAGDGTTTAVVLAEAIYREGMRQVAAGADPMALKRGIDRAVDAILADLKARSKPVTGTKSMEEIAVIASGNDREIGALIAGALEKVGRDGVVTLEEGKSIDTEVKVVEGMQFDRGFLSPHFVTDPEAVQCVLEKPFILIHEDKLSSAAKLVPLLEKAAKAKAPLLVIAEEIEGDALAVLVVNKLRGILEVCAVKAPAYGDRRKAMMEDLAILTGGKAFFKDTGFDIEKIGLDDLGRAKKVIVDADNTTIVEGAGDRKAVDGRIAQIKREKDETTSDYDREKLEERLAKLSGGVGQIRVGGATETQMKERKSRIDDALHATRAAIEEGTVPGGGVALLRARKALDGLGLSGDEATGVEVVRRSCEAPLRQIAENAGVDGGVAVKRVLAAGGDAGYDAERDLYHDLRQAGVVDAAKVTRTALQNAASVAGLMLTTECLVCDLPEEKADAHAGHAHG
jgi:chaperonin GroEL